MRAREHQSRIAEQHCIVANAVVADINLMEILDRYSREETDLHDAALLVQLGQQNVFLRPVDWAVCRWQVALVHQRSNELRIKAARPAEIARPALRNLRSHRRQVWSTSLCWLHHVRREKRYMSQPGIELDERRVRRTHILSPSSLPSSAPPVHASARHFRRKR